jgi:ABC-type multidrug transport system fused ATPase/permease subunit
MKMTSNVKEKFKESFVNVQFAIVLTVTILSIILYFVFNLEFLLYLFLFGLFLIILFVIGFLRNVKMQKHADDVRSGKNRYEPYTIDKETFVEECKNGLMYSLIRIDDNIYEVEAQLDRVNSTNYDNFVCYINNEEIVGVDAFLNYKFDGVRSFNDLDAIEFLEYNNNEPKKYFVDKKIDL